MIWVRFYKPNNQFGLPNTMIESIQHGILPNDNDYIEMSEEEFNEYNQSYKAEWEAFLATYTPPEVQNE